MLIVWNGFQGFGTLCPSKGASICPLDPAVWSSSYIRFPCNSRNCFYGSGFLSLESCLGMNQTSTWVWSSVFQFWALRFWFSVLHFCYRIGCSLDPVVFPFVDYNIPHHFAFYNPANCINLLILFHSIRRFLWKPPKNSGQASFNYDIMNLLGGRKTAAF